MRICLLISLFVFSVNTFAQEPLSSDSITLEYPNPTNDFTEFAQRLVGEGVEILSVTTNQLPNHSAVAWHKAPKEALGIKEGLLLTTGTAKNILGPNKKGTTTAQSNKFSYDTNGKLISTNFNDPDIMNLITGENNAFDICTIELDILPSADTLIFNYVFGSEEYDEYVCSPFNDVFAFFLSGPSSVDENGNVLTSYRKMNIAMVPGTNTPVAINNVNKGNPKTEKCIPSHPEYYVRNVNNPFIEYDGYTKVLSVKIKVVPGQIYHLKISIADISDFKLDSGVLIEGSSISSYFFNSIVYFDADKSSLTSKAREEVKRTIEELKKANKDYGIILTGHTDSDGDYAYNQNLSERRALTVQKQLLQAGVPLDKIQIKYKGEMKPAATNSHDTGKYENRRVEIMVVGG